MTNWNFFYGNQSDLFFILMKLCKSPLPQIVPSTETSIRGVARNFKMGGYISIRGDQCIY